VVVFGVSCGCGDASFFVFSGLVVGGDGIFGVSCRCGDASFLCFQDDEEVGCKVSRRRRRMSEWNVLRMWGLRRRRRMYHVRKEPVPYSMNYKESVL
jgi:hypothetical protein